MSPLDNKEVPRLSEIMLKPLYDTSGLYVGKIRDAVCNNKGELYLLITLPIEVDSLQSYCLLPCRFIKVSSDINLLIDSKTLAKAPTFKKNDVNSINQSDLKAIDNYFEKRVIEETSRDIKAKMIADDEGMPNLREEENLAGKYPKSRP